MDRAPHDEPYCYVLYLESDEVGILGQIPESCLDVARRCGWHLLVKESDVQPLPIEPSQRNPNRTGDQ